MPIVIGGAAPPAVLQHAGRQGAAHACCRSLVIAALEPMTLAQTRRRRRARPHQCRQRVVRPAGRGARHREPAQPKPVPGGRATRRSVFGPGRVIVEDAISGALTYRELLAGARILGRRFEAVSAPGEAVGLLLPNSNGVAMSLLGLLSGGRVAAMINYTAGPANVTASIRTAIIRTVVSSRAFIEKANLDDIVAAVEKAGGANSSGWRICAAAFRRPDKLLAALLLAAAARHAGRENAGGHPVHLGIGGHAEGGGAVQPQPARQCAPGRSPHCAVGRGQAAQRAAGLPLLRADGRHRSCRCWSASGSSSTPRRCTTS